MSLESVLNKEGERIFKDITIETKIINLKVFFRYLFLSGMKEDDIFYKPAEHELSEEYKNLLKYFEAWLVMKNYKPRGIEDKVRSARDFLEYAEIENIDIKTFGIKEAEKYREELRLTRNKNGETRYNPKTINNIIVHLILFYKFMVSINLAIKNSFLHIEKMKGSRSIPKNILTIEQIEKLLNSIKINSVKDFEFKVLIELLYSTGARISEIENLKSEDIHDEEGYLIIRDDKSRQDRKTLLTEYSCELLKFYLKHVYTGEHNTVFYHGCQRALNVWANRRLGKLIQEFNLPKITCHGIRHSIATHLLKKGADIREVQEYLGHKSIGTTEIYTRIFPEDLKDVVEKNHPREGGCRVEK